jgi:hypothetical protein
MKRVYKKLIKIANLWQKQFSLKCGVFNAIG